MNKRKVVIGLLIVMIMSLGLAGCGGPNTLEEWIHSDSSGQEMLDNISTEELEVTVEDNTIVYTYTYATPIDSSYIDLLAKQLEDLIANSASTFTDLADILEEESGIDGISVDVVYLNSDGSLIYSTTF